MTELIRIEPEFDALIAITQYEARGGSINLETSRKLTKEEVSAITNRFSHYHHIGVRTDEYSDIVINFSGIYNTKVIARELEVLIRQQGFNNILFNILPGGEEFYTLLS